MCTHPIPVKDMEEDAECGYASETFCPLMCLDGWSDDEPTVFNILDIYENVASVRIAVNEEYKKIMKEASKLVEEMHKRRALREGKKEVEE